MSSILAFQVGDHVLIEGISGVNSQSAPEKSGIVRFIGKTQFKEGDWLGVELDTPSGKNDGSVAGVRYFTCEPFHGLFVPPNKARLNLSGFESSIGSVNSHPPTPNHIEKIDNFQMDFSSINDISDSFGPTSGEEPFGLKTPSANVKSQQHTPLTSEIKVEQNDIIRLRDQILSLKSDLEQSSTSKHSPSKDKVSSIASKLNSMLEAYETVANRYEAQLKHFLMARKASKLDGSYNPQLEQQNTSLLKEKVQFLDEIDRLRKSLYSEMDENEHFKQQIREMDSLVTRLQHEARQNSDGQLRAEQELEKLRFDNTKVRTELEVETALEEERHRRSLDHENHVRELKAQFESDLHEKKLQIADLQNEVAFLKQSEKVLEEELNSRRMRITSAIGVDEEDDVKRENTRLREDLLNSRRQVEELKKLYEKSEVSKSRSEQQLRSEMESLKSTRSSTAGDDDLKSELKELSERMKQIRTDNEELTWALSTTRKDCEQLKICNDEHVLKLQEKEKRLQNFSHRINELENQNVSAAIDTVPREAYEMELKKLKESLLEEKGRHNTSAEHISALRRKISLIEREKELLEEQLRTRRLSAFSQGEFQSFSSFIQGLKRHIDAEILSLDPLRLTLQDVVRAKEMVDILMKVAEDVRVKVLNHLNQVEEIMQSRTLPTFTNESSIPIASSNSSTSALVETVKVDRVRNFDLGDTSAVRRRLDFRESLSAAPSTAPLASDTLRYLREPLGVTGTSMRSQNSASSNRYSAYNTTTAPYSAPTENRVPERSSNIENRVNNFKYLVSELRSKQHQPHPQSLSNFSSSANRSVAFETRPPIDPFSTRQILKVHEPARCNLCHEYGHDALSCPDYLSGSDSEESILRDIRSNFTTRPKYSSYSNSVIAR